MPTLRGRPGAFVGVQGAGQTGCAYGGERWWLAVHWTKARTTSSTKRASFASLDDHARGVLNRDADGVHWPYGPNIYVQMRADLLD
ncbi:hypothetical protein [Streptomyces sp. NPDC058457]|uniref:hypothetical protein n=1 Tax=Streptomyces sp. NPDC058457 TaxID=3346507 RepID=UPI00365E9F9C